MTLKMTSAQVVETSVNVISNSPSQDYTHPDDRTLLYDMTPGFKPFTNYLLTDILCLGRLTTYFFGHYQYFYLFDKLISPIVFLFIRECT